MSQYRRVTTRPLPASRECLLQPVPPQFVHRLAVVERGDADAHRALRREHEHFERVVELRRHELIARIAAWPQQFLTYVGQRELSSLSLE